MSAIQEQLKMVVLAGVPWLVAARTTEPEASLPSCAVSYTPACSGWLARASLPHQVALSTGLCSVLKESNSVLQNR